ncbi:CRISPR-associated endonuclease Cas2 [Pasteurella atlantica]|uniref:CRISPR-associated endoribonuclease Cas2 n=3 Tax=Pasteurellaceae TaxID=712 RepID=A0AAJ6NCU2_9PAST|nr:MULTISPECIES: CRISPR-associated endonuclease Cas2 [Pasteurella]MDP8033567.1 CRISPR-associated endonuclease Cas2 [Pasteurella atlantica]MDP8035502.1 CRISPR-associated endonuclease Cas2 [Pasteurella atlantica]MDP8037453.1 CRISPR-associated endonuclease Cas2 [Pasteurella atlantica]MDP8047802.1 CRISPR-associated endonuclease Cas2 [Pasteurella atlantica]MDP8049637.1 CRISPR-associated endonuclease Cas2 [Pasteurella atlantica]
MKKYLIGYDIADEKRLQRIYRKVLKYATPIQYSLFIFEGEDVLLQKCINDILTVFDEKEDDLRIYPLSTRGLQWTIGKPLFPEGIIWTGLPAGFIS